VSVGEMMNITDIAVATMTTARVTYINAGPTYRRTFSMSLVDRVIMSPVENRL
jgi:hypothetical protein